MRRRAILAGAMAAVVAAGLYRFTGLFAHRYPPTPYDDLLGRLIDRDQAAKLGTHVSGPFDAAAEAGRLRRAFQDKAIGQVAGSDIAAGRMAEVDGWLVPQTIARLSALAAHTQTSG